MDLGDRGLGFRNQRFRVPGSQTIEFEVSGL